MILTGYKGWDNLNDLLIESFIKTKKELQELGEKDPDLARAKAIEALKRMGLIGEDGKLTPPYNGEKVNDEDFTRGPGEIDNGDER